MSYFDREKAEKAIRAYADIKHNNGENIIYINGILKAISVLDELPNADVVEVKHGKWEEIKTGEKMYDYCFKCSNCHGETPPNSFVVSPDYCPNCGAKMDGGNAE